MDVVDWRDTPRALMAAVRAPRRYWSPTLIGVVGTLLIHSLIVPSAYLGNRGRKARSPETQESGELLKLKSDSTEPLVLITLPGISSSSHAISQDITVQFSLSKIVVPSPLRLEAPTALDFEILTLGEEQPSQATGISEVGADQIRLSGVYAGQIRARVERIWRRPRTPVNQDVRGEVPTVADASFRCQVQIVQDQNGFVQEVLLPRCNGSAAWQRSLVMAIQQASPLPAPPSARVFSRSIVLNFIGLPYGSNSFDEDYEMESGNLARIGNHD